MTDLKPQIRAIDLAVSAGRKRQSARTRFVHLFAGEEAPDTVPLYDNFCFAFALLRLKTAEAVGEARELIDRLLAFQTEEGNFPLYLHDYPQCWDPCLALKIAPILIHAGRLFPTLKQKLEAPLRKALEGSKPKTALWERRLSACLGKPLEPIDTSAFSAEEWREHIITEQLFSHSDFPVPYNSLLQMFLGEVAQERSEPQPVPIEWGLADGRFSKRLLRDHPKQLLAASLFPFQSSVDTPDSMSWTGTRLLWQGASQVHSLTFSGARVFCNLSTETELFIEGQKGTVFELGQEVEIRTPTLSVRVKFNLEEGEGRFCGHILRANRPSYKKTDSYEAFDACVSLRVLSCSEPCLVRLTLSTASPMTCSPLSTYIVVPVTAEAFGERRKAATSATSSA